MLSISVPEVPKKDKSREKNTFFYSAYNTPSPNVHEHLIQTRMQKKRKER